MLPKHISIVAAKAATAASSSAAVAAGDEALASELTDAQRDALGSLGDYAEIDGKPSDVSAG